MNELLGATRPCYWLTWGQAGGILDFSDLGHRQGALEGKFALEKSASHDGK